MHLGFLSTVHKNNILFLLVPVSAGILQIQKSIISRHTSTTRLAIHTTSVIDKI